MYARMDLRAGIGASRPSNFCPTPLQSNKEPILQRSFPFFAGVVLAKDSVGKLEVTMRWAMDGGIARGGSSCAEGLRQGQAMSGT
jgi:hypothetical protein